MNCIIVDDEYPARKELEYFINTFSSIKVLHQFDDSLKALEFIQTHNVDVLFLDINMPKLNGIAFSKIVKNLNSKPIIVFITAYGEYAVEAFEVEAFDYILKPYCENRILTTFNRLERLKNKEVKENICKDKLTLWKNNKLIVVNINDIYYCKAHEREVYIYTQKENFIIVSSISDFMQKLPQSNFFRCHRSYIVNLDKIVEIIPWFNNTYMIKLQELDEEVPVSRNNIGEFKRKMGI